ncbi:MAG TPA: hypothetical protein VKZ49_19365, partial [Polyangiaceae bacterium]|nr:hypothetical protein [Polyangiaceae bacterium]
MGEREEASLNLRMSLEDLLKRALLAGALQVRLIPGRRTVVVLPSGESEVRGEVQTPDSINALLEPILPVEARRSLAGGWAEWDFALSDKGTVRATAELKLGLPHVVLSLTECDGAPATRPAEAATARDLRRQSAPETPQASPAASRRLSSAHDVPAVLSAPLSRAFRAAPPAAAAPAGSPLPTEPPPPPIEVAEAHLSGGSSREIDELLSMILELNGSDLHVSTGAPPMIRVDGDLRPVPHRPVLTAEQVQRMLWPIVPRRNREEFSKTHDTDFSYELPGRCRFRGN